MYFLVMFIFNIRYTRDHIFSNININNIWYMLYSNALSLLHIFNIRHYRNNDISLFNHNIYLQ